MVVVFTYIKAEAYQAAFFFEACGGCSGAVYRTGVVRRFDWRWRISLFNNYFPNKWKRSFLVIRYFMPGFLIFISSMSRCQSFCDRS